jgi:CPA1 family monovalent cation:H+ antiporter
VILLTLLVQGLTLPYLITRLGLFDSFSNDKEEEETKKIKKDLKQHVHQFLKTKYDNETDDRAGMAIFLRKWEEKVKMTDDDRMNEKTKVIFLEILECQRQYLTELNKDPSIDEEIIRMQLYQIDLEEERLKLI